MIELKIGEQLMAKLNMYEVRCEYEHGDADATTHSTARFGDDEEQLKQLTQTVTVLMAMSSASYNDQLCYMTGSRDRSKRFAALQALCPEIPDGVIADVMDGYEERDVVYDGDWNAAHLVDVDIVYYNDRGIMFEVDIIAKD